MTSMILAFNKSSWYYPIITNFNKNFWDGTKFDKSNLSISWDLQNIVKIRGYGMY
jgi:hypothetical protein